jgi:transcription-repair coupling factor (superfamily II helicase)
VPPKRQRDILKAAGRGQIDILIGTHRLLSGDVSLPNPGLLVLDEEQRFGVRHKEKLKLLKKNVDVLALTATPIPRTLQLSMSGIRDLSIIETAPLERKPVATAILHRDDAVLRDMLERELAREGQVFWVHNRVQGLERVVEYVRRLVPQARLAMAHGQMAEGALEGNMRKFWHGEVDVLVCTSIVESGLDFPRANTLVVDQAQLFGLGQLYQLRGRVGRSDRQAYAIFLLPSEERLSEVARERLRIILELDYLGAGFQIAMEDLRLRGAGNILGEVQSGHMSRVGLELFLEMLEEAVTRLKGGGPPPSAETELQIHVPAHIPEAYVADAKERLRCYKSLASAVDGRRREEITLELRDRFGPLPPEVENFLSVLDMKAFFTSLHVREAALYPDRARLIWAEGQRAVSAAHLVALVAEKKGARLVPPATLEYPLDVEGSVPQRLSALRTALETVRIAENPSVSSP